MPLLPSGDPKQKQNIENGQPDPGNFQGQRSERQAGADINDFYRGNKQK